MKTLLVAVALLSACGGAAANKETTEEPQVEADEATGEARSVVDEIHASIKRGSPEGMLPIVAEDVVVIGARGGDFFTDRNAVIVALTDALGNQREQKHTVRPRGLQVHAAPGGRSAFATEQVDVDGSDFVVTALLASVDDIWVVSAVYAAHPMDKKQKKGAVAPPPVQAGVADGAGDAAGLFRSAVADPEPRAAFGNQLADDETATWIASNGEITRGAKKIKKAWKKAVKKKQPTMQLSGDVRAATSPDGGLAWVLADVAIGSKKAEPVPGRAFYVYRRDGAGWRLVVAHEAVISP